MEVEEEDVEDEVGFPELERSFSWEREVVLVLEREVVDWLGSKWQLC